MQARFGGEPRFLMKKHIPSGKGMGGSSALAASMALAWAEESGGRVDAELALSLGSDVPYMLTGGEARVTGRGEDVTHLPYVAREALVLPPKGGGETAEADALYDRMKEEGSLPERRGEYFNDLYAPAARLCPDVGRAVRALEESGAENAVMTGSGSAVCAFFEDKEELARVAERVGGEFDSLILRTLPARGERIPRRKCRYPRYSPRFCALSAYFAGNLCKKPQFAKNQNKKTRTFDVFSNSLLYARAYFDIM